MARLTITVRGIAKFEQFAKSLPGIAAPEVLRPIILRAAERFEESIRNIARYYSDTGATEKTIEARLVKDASAARGYTTINFARTLELKNIVRAARGQRAAKNKARYPFIVARGAPPHVIRSRDGFGLLIAGSAEFGGEVVEEVQHPGFAGTEFFARGVRAVRATNRREIEREIKAECKKLARQFGVAAS